MLWLISRTDRDGTDTSFFVSGHKRPTHDAKQARILDKPEVVEKAILFFKVVDSISTV